MKKLLCSLLILASIAVSAQKTMNDPNVEKRNVSGFHGVSASGGIDLYISYGEEAVAVSASETKYRDNIKTEVKNGILYISFDWKNNLKLTTVNRKLKAYVSYKTLDKLGGSGGSDIFVDGTIKSDKLSIELSGGSDFDGKVEVNDLDIEASGGSDLTISGSAKNLDARSSGGSDINGYGLAADVCNLEASGGSDISITVNKELTAKANGGSDVTYKGAGVVREMKSSGSSSIKKTSK